MRHVPALVVSAVLLACAVYNVALAAGAGSIGPEPGDDVAGAGFVAGVATIAILVGAVVAAVSWWWPSEAVALLAPSAALFLVTFWRTYDPYYAPNKHRYSDGALGPSPIAIVVILAFLLGGLTLKRPRQGAALTIVMLPIVLITAALAGDGH